MFANIKLNSQQFLFSFENATQQVNPLIYIKQLRENVLHNSHVLVFKNNSHVFKLYYPHPVQNYGLYSINQ
jgi:hypothetical protein